MDKKFIYYMINTKIKIKKNEFSKHRIRNKSIQS